MPFGISIFKLVIKKRLRKNFGPLCPFLPKGFRGKDVLQEDLRVRALSNLILIEYCKQEGF